MHGVWLQANQWKIEMTTFIRRYHFFIKTKNGFEIHIPETLDEYIYVESLTKPGTYCFQQWIGSSDGSFRVKTNAYKWVAGNLEEIPEEFKAWLLITGFNIT